MVDVPKLKGRMVEYGYNYRKLAPELGLHENTLRRHFDQGIFDSEEISGMRRLFKLTDAEVIRIFFN